MIKDTRIALVLMGWFALAQFASAVGIIVAAKIGNLDVQDGRRFGLIAFMVGCVIWYFALGAVFRIKSHRWSLYLVKENDGLRQFKGTPLFGLWAGQLWRHAVVSVGIQGLTSLLKTMYGSYLNNVAEFSIETIGFLSTSYLAFLWLLKYQYGIFQLVRTLDGTTYGTSPVLSEVVHLASLGQSASVSDSVASLRSLIGGVLSTVAVVSYLVIGLVQFFAMYDFFREYWGWWSIPSGLASMFVSYMPLVGSIAGVVAATNVWGWSLINSLLLFFFPIVIMLIVGVLVGFGNLVSSLAKR